MQKIQTCFFRFSGNHVFTPHKTGSRSISNLKKGSELWLICNSLKSYSDNNLGYKSLNNVELSQITKMRRKSQATVSLNFRLLVPPSPTQLAASIFGLDSTPVLIPCGPILVFLGFQIWNHVCTYSNHNIINMYCVFSTSPWCLFLED
jgi:hypothetical protein